MKLTFYWKGEKQTINIQLNPYSRKVADRNTMQRIEMSDKLESDCVITLGQDLPL